MVSLNKMMGNPCSCQSEIHRAWHGVNEKTWPDDGSIPNHESLGDFEHPEEENCVLRPYEAVGCSLSTLVVPATRDMVIFTDRDGLRSQPKPTMTLVLVSQQNIH